MIMCLYFMVMYYEYKVAKNILILSSLAFKGTMHKLL